MLMCLWLCLTVFETRLIAGYCSVFNFNPLKYDCAYQCLSLCWLWCSFTTFQVIVGCLPTLLYLTDQHHLEVGQATRVGGLSETTADQHESPRVP